MNILWVCNIALPEASRILNEKPLPFGGWFVSISKLLSTTEGINLTIAFPKAGIEKIKKINGERITYYLFCPFTKNEIEDYAQDNRLNDIIKEVKPDVIHVFGTEYLHSLGVLKLNSVDKTIISIQGLISICAKHYFASLGCKIVRKNTFRDFLKNDNILKAKKAFEKRGKYEIETIKLAKYIIGRTEFDYAYTRQIRSDSVYFKNNEILRENFYNKNWDLNKCEKYSIFVSQGGYPIKGLHYVLEAMPTILKKFPDTRLYVGGADITKGNTLVERLKLTAYGAYLKKLIKEFNLKNKVIFTGILDEEKMCERYMDAHVFVCPSSIENSPNSLGEAMIVGTPCVASYVGGIPDLLENNNEGFLYQHDAPYMLAHYVCKIFDDDILALKLSKNAQKRALKTHSKEKNIIELLEIYNKVSKNNKE